MISYLRFKVSGVLSMRLIGMSLAAVLIAGCSLHFSPDTPTEAPPDMSLTVTPESEAEATEAPTEIMTPTVTPIPTIAPEIALSEADRLVAQGRYEAALTHYQDVIDQGDAPAPELQAAALLGQGQAALRDGFFEEAVTAFTEYLTRFSGAELDISVYFLRGDAHLGLQAWQSALEDYQQYLALQPGMIDSYIYERVGDAHLALGQVSHAIASYTNAINTSRTFDGQFALRERLAMVYSLTGQWSLAVAEYDAILESAQAADYRAAIEYRAAQAYMSAGDNEMGLGRMQRVFDTYPTSLQAYQAMQVLLSHERTPDRLAQARASFAYGDYHHALDVLNYFTAHSLLVSIPVEAYLLLGRTYREIESPDAAMVAFQTIVDQYPRDAAFGVALLEQGRTRQLSGDVSGAIRHYEQMAASYSYLPEAPEAIWQAGYLYAVNDEPQSARPLFELLADKYVNSLQARSGLLFAASGAMQAGDLTSAEMLFGRLATIASGEYQAMAYYMAARLALLRGDQGVANQALAMVAQASTDGYYSVRAQELQAGIEAFQPPSSINLTFDEQAERAAADAWLREIFALESTGDLWRLTPTLEADPRLVRGLELWKAGAFGEAQAEFAELVNAYAIDGIASYQLAVFFKELGAYRNSIVAAANVIRVANVSTLAASPYIARMRYPVYYADLIKEISEEYAIDPLILFALIRHESLYDTHTTGEGGKKGLTQIAPSAGEYIASELGREGYQHRDLFRAYEGVTFGAYYLAEHLDQFEGNVIAALAAYHAGAARAAEWYKLSGGDADLFFNTITLDGTQNYVRQVFNYYTIYRALYGVD